MNQADAFVKQSAASAYLKPSTNIPHLPTLVHTFLITVVAGDGGQDLERRRRPSVGQPLLRDGPEERRGAREGEREEGSVEYGLTVQWFSELVVWGEVRGGFSS